MAVRRSSSELEAHQKSTNSAKYRLMEQTHFSGSDEELSMMQDYERAYIDGHPKISDEEWDILKNRLGYEESLVAGARSGRSWVHMQAPLPSIRKVTSEDDIREFIESYAADGQELLIECKLDGLTANVMYQLDGDVYRFDKITTRGNGRYGMQLNDGALAGVVTNIPDEIPSSAVLPIVDDYNIKTGSNATLPETLELRGEAVIPKNDKARARYGEYPVWRNIASGMFNRKSPQNLPGLVETLGIPVGEVITDKAARRAVLGLIDTKAGRAAEVTVQQDLHTVSITEKGETKSYTTEDEYLDVVFYSVAIDGSNFDSPLLSGLGLKTVADIEFEDRSLDKTYAHTYRKISGDADTLLARTIEAVNGFYGIDPTTGKRDPSLRRLRNEYEYACDGVVIKPANSSRKTQEMDVRKSKSGKSIVVPRYPADIVAVKYLSETVHVTLAKITKNTTDLGNVTFTGELDHEYVTESGARVKSINLHNEDWLRENSWIHEGGDYDMCMSMDIIPVLLRP